MAGYGTRYGTPYGVEAWLDTAEPPTIFNQYPVSGAINVSARTEIKFSLTDDVSVVLSSTRIYVNAVLVFDGSAFQTGWTDSFYITNGVGWDFTLRHSDDLPYGAPSSVRVIAKDPSNNTLDTTWVFTVELRPLLVNAEIRLVTSDMLRVYYPVAVVNSSDLASIANYQITAISDSSDVVVREIGGVAADAGSTQIVDVYTTKLKLGELYRIEIFNQRTVDGQLLTSGPVGRSDGVKAEFESHRTKIDSMRGGFSELYQKSGTGSILLQILIALGLEDERIGGQGELAAIPTPSVPATTYGTADYGTDTYDALGE